MIAVCLCAGASLGLGAELAHLFPAGGPRGQNVGVTATGKFTAWPVECWVSGEGIKMVSDKTKGKLLMTIAPDAEPGVRWLRMIDEDGASAPRPFVVGAQSELLEKEPNNELREAQTVAKAGVINGALGKPGDVDVYSISLGRGETLVAAVEAEQPLGSPMDGVLQIVSASGFVLEQNHDDRCLDPRIVFTAPEQGIYMIRLFAFPSTPDSSIRLAGDASYIYRLTITTGPFLDHAFPLAVSRDLSSKVRLEGWNILEAASHVVVPAGIETDLATVFHPQMLGTAQVAVVDHAAIVELEPNDAAHLQQIDLPVTVSGRIDESGDDDVYRIVGVKKGKLLVTIESRTLGFPLDPVLELTDATGKSLVRVDDSSIGRDPELTYSFPADGEYRLIVSDLNNQGSPRHLYRMHAVVPEPDFSLALANHAFVVTPGKPLEIPITVKRLSKFAGDIRIEIIGLPQGMTSEAVVTKRGDPKKKSPEVAKLVVNVDDAKASGLIRISGVSVDDPLHRRVAQAEDPKLKAKTPDVWISAKTGSTPEK